MKKIFVFIFGVMMIALVAAATPTLITQFNEKDVTFAKPVEKVSDEITAENVTFLCDGKADYVTVGEHDVRTGYDDEFKDDKIMRGKCPTGIITAVTDWNGNKLRSYGDESKRTLKSFSVNKGRAYDCKQEGNNWTNSECKTIVKEVLEVGELEI